MELLELQTESWDQTHYAKIPEYDLVKGEYVVIQFENGQDLAKIVNIKKIDEPESRLSAVTVTRKVTENDIKKYDELNKSKIEALKHCKDLVQKYKLPMKLVDCHFSLDGGRVIFGFIADGRVDFRVLVKELTRHFQKTVRLQQMGIRDEAKLFGDIGACGRLLCCRKFLNELSSITSDYAKVQGVEHRGCERLSGVCGRLKCCLAFEADIYKELMEKLPKVGTKIKTKNGQGVVCNQNVLKQSVMVKVEDKYIEIPYK